MDIESESKIIQKFIDKGNYHAAINIAISALNECRRIENQAGIDVFLGIIRGVADSMTEKFGS